MNSAFTISATNRFARAHHICELEHQNPILPRWLSEEGLHAVIEMALAFIHIALLVAIETVRTQSLNADPEGIPMVPASIQNK
jgi:hypothetical protein